jgi:hypothetical protein
MQKNINTIMTKKFDNFYKTTLQTIKESSLSRIWSHTQDYTCGAITAFRGERVYAANRQLLSELKKYLLGKGYDVTRVSGNYVENPNEENRVELKEPSLFVVNSKVDGDDDGELEDVLFKLGEYYEQESVLIIPPGGKDAYLLGTSKKDTAWPGYKEKVVVGNGKFGKVAGQYLSRIHSREYAFEHVEKPQTINGRRGLSLFVEKIDRDMVNE